MTRTLEAGQYWKLRALCTETQRCVAAAMQAQAALTTATQRQTAILRDLDLDPATPTFTLDDDALTVTVPDA